MSMSETKIDDFIKELSSKAAVPGGGGAAALVAAIATSLGNMVLALTTGKKKYAEYEEEVQETIVKANELTQKMLNAMDEDAKAFEPLSKAYGLPKNTEEEIKVRDAIMEKALVDAAMAPLGLMELCLEAIRMIKRIAVIGSRLAISDAGVAISFLKSAIESASLNVYINTKLMKNREKALELEERADALLEEAKPLADETFAIVIKAIRG